MKVEFNNEIEEVIELKHFTNLSDKNYNTISYGVEGDYLVTRKDGRQYIEKKEIIERYFKPISTPTPRLFTVFRGHLDPESGLITTVKGCTCDICSSFPTPIEGDAGEAI